MTDASLNAVIDYCLSQFEYYNNKSYNDEITNKNMTDWYAAKAAAFADVVRYIEIKTNKSVFLKK